MNHSPTRGNPKKKIFSRIREQMETHQSEMKIQSNRINDLVQRRNSQSVFQTQQQLDGANRKLVQLQSHRDN